MQRRTPPERGTGWHGRMHAPSRGDAGCSALLSPRKGRNTPPPEELLRTLGAGFQPRQLESCTPLFLSSPTTESSGQVVTDAVPARRTPFVRILALDSHRHSYSQPHRLHTFGVRVCTPSPKPGTWRGASCAAPGPCQGVAN